MATRVMFIVLLKFDQRLIAPIRQWRMRRPMFVISDEYPALELKGNETITFTDLFRTTPVSVM